MVEEPFGKSYIVKDISFNDIIKGFVAYIIKVANNLSPAISVTLA